MKTILLFFALTISIQAFSCDKDLEQFPRDCKLQDRLRKIQKKLKESNIDVNDVADYRAMRFIDRATWDWATTYKVKPKDIYKPIPITWEVWSHGIDVIFIAGEKLPGILWRGLKLDRQTFASMNLNLLVDGDKNIKDSATDKNKNSGEYRTAKDIGVGYCDNKAIDLKAQLALQAQIKESRISMEKFQAKWEAKVGLTFAQLVFRDTFAVANVTTPKMWAAVTDIKSSNCSGVWVSYIPSAEVASQVEWVRIFINENLKLYKAGKPILSPVELAAYAQKWFVTIHPFADGNGRTSRAIQDMILANFALPFAPAGDLWRDATEQWTNYLENTYAAMDKAMTSLEECLLVDYRLPLDRRPFKCATTTELNK